MCDVYKKYRDIQNNIKKLGVNNISVIDVKNIVFSRSFRELCEMNSCGMYNRSWMCPPEVGSIDDLISIAKDYSKAIVYNTIHDLEDSFDIEGMLKSGETHNKISFSINKILRVKEDLSVLHLSAGGCKICKVCSKVNSEPCRYPDEAIASLEAYGISVSDLARQSGMNYINGTDTVTYFGCVLVKER